ncbi:hypothetical protein JET18_18620 [Chryseobacterium sp. L7]|uniref:Zf-HC2 domain-containing protein n=1 Tax=Chryseobacterium endalhagicum TaxID=2797638 RepID=A0ABS1QJU1_9FLAO|nr:hypothetical protein [Chryseobacterium endalhagicum]MBL1222877.1 hypothetical protein [Chryseobacterium endalhagicum]
MLRKFIHILFLPCSKATMLMEKRNAKAISRKEDWQLSMHLKICKWCRAYEEKLKILDDILKRKLSRNEKTEINDVDIQNFKSKVLEKLDI